MEKKKTFIPITGRSYWTNSGRLCMSFQSHCNATAAAIATSVKQLKLMISSEWWSYTSTSLPTTAFFRWRWPEGCRKMQPAVQGILRCWQAPNIELTVNIRTKKRPVHFHTICTLRWMIQNNKHFSALSPSHIPSVTWFVSNNPKSVSYA